jgi:hypothetical protein
MRRNKGVVAGVVLAAGLSLGSGPAGAGSGTPFDGGWTSTDTDGSHQTLTVTGSAASKRAVTLYDDMASTCGGAPAQVSGSATADGAYLTMRGTLTCRPRGNIFRTRVGIAWEYDATTDTITDDFGVTWTRAG